MDKRFKTALNGTDLRIGRNLDKPEQFVVLLESKILGFIPISIKVLATKEDMKYIVATLSEELDKE